MRFLNGTGGAGSAGDVNPLATLRLVVVAGASLVILLAGIVMLVWQFRGRHHARAGIPFAQPPAGVPPILAEALLLLLPIAVFVFTPPFFYTLLNLLAPRVLPEGMDWNIETARLLTQFATQICTAGALFPLAWMAGLPLLGTGGTAGTETSAASNANAASAGTAAGKRPPLLPRWHAAPCFLAAATLVVTLTFVSHVIAWVSEHVLGITLNTNKQEVVEMVMRHKDEPLFLMAAVAALVIGAPLVEELFFRGALFPTLHRLAGRVPAIVLTGVLFGAIHFNAMAFLPLSALGAYLCIAYERTGNLRVCIATHALFNLYSLVLMVAAPELAAPPAPPQ